ERGELDLVRTRNGLLPKLDMFIALGGTTYASSFSPGDDRDGQGWDASLGLKFQYNLGNRAELAQHRRTTLNQLQVEQSLRNMEQTVQVDVRSAHVKVQVAAEKIRATEATRKLREESSRIEAEKFRVGRSTEILVAQAWRDLVTAEIAEISAVIAYRKALVDLYRLEGSLLERRGVIVSEPGESLGN
ncbi:MAG TPA: TolC family protein, partial [bacterium]|nr:TolC family protein [bacterium]